MKKIIVVGNGGRENAICYALKNSPQNPRIYNFATFINPGIKKLGVEIVLTDALSNFADLEKLIKEISPNLVIIGPENPIEDGMSDFLKELGIPCFAPSQKNVQLETSKSFTRNLLKKYKIDASPDFFVSENINDSKSRENFYQKFNGQIVVKADGLLGGKGVLVAGDHFDDFKTAEDFAKKSIEKFGKVVLEEKLIGPEFSVISIVDGETVLDTQAIQDNKLAGINDTGPQTGGMGTISDENLSLPFIDKNDLVKSREITLKTMKAIAQETGEKYVGVMYGGFIKTKNGVKLIEYNARFGDPEALNILPMMKTDFVEVCEKATQGKLHEISKLDFYKQATVLKYLCAKGYPTSPKKGAELDLPGNWDEDTAKVFFAGIKEEDEKNIICGGRAIAVIGIGKNLAEANNNCEAKIREFSLDHLFYREDIGTEKLIEKRMNILK